MTFGVVSNFPKKKRRVGGPKFRVFFFPLPPENSFFSSLFGCLLVEFWWCLKRQGAQMCTFGVLRLLCEALAAPKPPGFHTRAVLRKGGLGGLLGRASPEGLRGASGGLEPRLPPPLPLSSPLNPSLLNPPL